MGEEGGPKNRKTDSCDRFLNEKAMLFLLDAHGTVEHFLVISTWLPMSKLLHQVPPPHIPLLSAVTKLFSRNRHVLFESFSFRRLFHVSPLWFRIETRTCFAAIFSFFLPKQHSSTRGQIKKRACQHEPGKDEKRGP